MRIRRTVALGCLWLVHAFGCSGPTDPSRVLTGNWSARGIGHSMAFGMSLTQEGDRISGVACGVDSGVVLFRGAPVSGEHPSVQFVVTADSAGPCCQHLVGSSFAGRQDGTRDIVGRYRNIDLRFEREERDSCQELARRP